MVGQIFADQIEVTMRHHALESGCFVVNATGWLTEDQIAKISPDDKLRRALRGRLHDGDHLARRARISCRRSRKAKAF